MPAPASQTSPGLRAVKPSGSFDRSTRTLQINTDITRLAQKISTASLNSPVPPNQSATSLTPHSFKSIRSFKSFSDVKSAAVTGISAILRPHTFQEYLDQTIPQLNPFNEDFSAYEWAKTLVMAKNSKPEKYPRRSAGISFQNLGAYGHSNTTDYQKTVLNSFYQLKNIVSPAGKKGNRKEILQNFNGVAHKGETCVVLGRPGR